MAYNIKQYVFMYSVLLGSMFAGASVVHNVLQPDLTLPVSAPPPPNPAPTAVPQPTSDQAEAPAARSDMR